MGNGLEAYFGEIGNEAKTSRNRGGRFIYTLHKGKRKAQGSSMPSEEDHTLKLKAGRERRRREETIREEGEERRGDVRLTIMYVRTKAT